MGIFPYVWSWGPCSGCQQAGDRPEGCPRDCQGTYPEVGKRKGMRCRILHRAKGSVHLEFEDGYKTITSLNGLRRADRCEPE